MAAIIKKDLRSYFTSLSGWLFLALMLFFIGFYTLMTNLMSGYPTFSYPLYSVNFIFMIAVPILSMRSLSEERRNRTDQLLLTSPTGTTGIVLGKYFSMVILLGIVCAVCLFGPLGLSLVGEIPYAVDYAMLLAFFLSGCAYLAIGLFLSSLTENPLISYISAFGVLLLLYLIEKISAQIPWEPLADLLQAISIQARLRSFINQIFDVRALIYFLSLTVFFVFLTIQLVNRRRWR